MASALNIFRTVRADLTDTAETLYTTPTGYTSIILMAQISNITSSSAQATFSHYDGTNTTYLIKDFSIPGNDSASATTGKLVIETGQSVNSYASANNTLQIVLSVLETLNG